MLVQELGRLPDNEQIIIRPGVLPMPCRKMRWYTDPHFRSRVLPPPEIQKLDVQIARDDGSTRILRKRPRAMSGLVEADIEQTPEAADVDPSPQ